MEHHYSIENLPTILDSNDSNEIIPALQFLINNLNLACSAKIVDAVEKLNKSTDVGIRFWAKKLSNNIANHEVEQGNAQIAAIPQDLPVDILVKKLQSVASTYVSLDVISKLCESQKPEALDFLKSYLTKCCDNTQISIITKNVGTYFPSEETLLFLMPYLKHEDDRIVANTIEGIENIDSPKVIVILSQLLEHKSNRVRTNAAIAIRKHDSEKSFMVISKMLAPGSGAHFQISACHAIKSLQDPKFLELLEPVLLKDITFSAALAAIAAIGGRPAINLLTNNYSQFTSDKQLLIDNIAAKLSRLEEKPLEKLGEKILASKVCAKANIFVEDCKEKLQTRISSGKKTCQDAKSYIMGYRLQIIISLSALACAIAFFLLPSKSPPITSQKPETIGLGDKLPDEAQFAIWKRKSQAKQSEDDQSNGRSITPTRQSGDSDEIFEFRKNLWQKMPLSFSDSHLEEILLSIVNSNSIQKYEILQKGTSLTTLQREDIMQQLLGNWVALSGEIQNVKAKPISGYNVECSAANPTQGIDKFYFDVEKRIALSLKKGATIRFVGTISGISEEIQQKYDKNYNSEEMLFLKISLENSIILGALFDAVEQKDIDFGRYLLKSLKYNPNAANHMDYRPLMKAIQNEDLAFVKMLVEFGAEVNFRANGYYGEETPLDVAVRSNYTEIADYLVSNGAKRSWDVPR